LAVPGVCEANHCDPRKSVIAADSAVLSGYNIEMVVNDLITRDPAVCGGQPVFRGTRVTLRTVLASLAEGDSIEQILHSFPTLKEEQVRGAVAFAASSAQEDLPLPELPAIR